MRGIAPQDEGFGVASAAFPSASYGQAFQAAARPLRTKSLGVPLKAAALQLPTAHPVIAATLTGARSRAEVEENVALFDLPIPASLWAELKAAGLLAADAPTPQPADTGA